MLTTTTDAIPLEKVTSEKLLDDIVTNVDDVGIIRELAKRLLQKTTIKKASGFMVELAFAVRGLNMYDIDNIRENSACQFFGDKYWNVRERILAVLKKEHQLKLFTSET